MIFNIKSDISITGLRKQRVHMSLSFNSGDADFHEVHRYEFHSAGTKIRVSHAGYVCSDAYYAFSEFDADAFPDLLGALSADTQCNVLKAVSSLKGYRLLMSGKAEDFPDGFPDGGEDPTRKEVEKRLEDINRIIADGYNGEEERKDPFFAETRPDGFEVDTASRTVEFSFTVDDEKFCLDFRFDELRNDYGLDLDEYADLFGM